MMPKELALSFFALFVLVVSLVLPVAGLGIGRDRAQATHTPDLNVVSARMGTPSGGHLRKEVIRKNELLPVRAE